MSLTKDTLIFEQYPITYTKMPALLSSVRGGNPVSKPSISAPLHNSGSLASFPQADLTPSIGTEFTTLQVSELLKADDVVIRDLAITSK